MWQNFKFPMNQEHRSLKSGADLWQHLASGRWTVNMWVTLHYLFMGPGLIQPAATTHTQPRSWTVCLVELSKNLPKVSQCLTPDRQFGYKQSKDPYILCLKHTRRRPSEYLAVWSGHCETSQRFIDSSTLLHVLPRPRECDLQRLG